jgi:hypothetical protein
MGWIVLRINLEGMINYWTVRVLGYGRRLLRINRKGRRRWFVPALLLACLAGGAPQRSDAQVLDIISIINTAVKKVIVAADLEVQQLQTQTIGLQNTQKSLENDMDESELTDITGWVQQQRDLFSEYYQELWAVKNALTTYEAVSSMISKQEQIIAGYKQAYSVLGQDQHFSAAELQHMYTVLSGIMSQSVQNLNRLTMVITALVTQMDDAGRLRIIDEAGSGINRNYSDLAQFSQQNFLLSLQRAKDANDVAVTRALYGIE